MQYIICMYVPDITLSALYNNLFNHYNNTMRQLLLFLFYIYKNEANKF